MFLAQEYSRLQRVVDLVLPFNQFIGTLPPEWGTLPQVTRIHVGNNSLGGSLPPVRYIN